MELLVCEIHFAAGLWVYARTWLGKTTTTELNLKTSALILPLLL